MFQNKNRKVTNNPKLPSSNAAPTLLSHMSCEKGSYGEREVQKLANRLVTSKSQKKLLTALIAYVLEVYPSNQQTLITVMNLASQNSMEELRLNFHDLETDMPNSLAGKLFHKLSTKERSDQSLCPEVAKQLQTFLYWQKK